MYDAIYKYSLETILDHINICNKRFSEIHNPSDFISTDYGKTLLMLLLLDFKRLEKI